MALRNNALGRALQLEPPRAEAARQASCGTRRVSAPWQACTPDRFAHREYARLRVQAELDRSRYPALPETAYVQALSSTPSESRSSLAIERSPSHLGERSVPGPPRTASQLTRPECRAQPGDRRSIG